MVVALTIVAIAGLAGVAGPGLFSMGEGFFVLGASAAVLATGVVGLLFSMHGTIKTVRRQQAAIDRLQDERARASDETQAQTAQDHEAQMAAQRRQQAAIDKRQDERARASEKAQARTDEAQEAEIEDLRSQEATHGGTNDKQAESPELSPFGDLHRVLDVEGIGRDFAGQLGDLDILDTEQLWRADHEAVASALDVPKKTVGNWQSMAELMALQHVGPQYAELLVRANVLSIDELANQDPAELASAVQDVESSREVRVQGNPVGVKHTRKWIEAASDHDPQGVRVER